MNRDLLACVNLLKMKGIRVSPDRLTMMSNNYEGEATETLACINLLKMKGVGSPQIA
jgi:hypothetical protein